MAQKRAGITMLSPLVHLIFLAQSIFGVWHYLNLDLPHAKKSYGGHWKYLTFWNMVSSLSESPSFRGRAVSAVTRVCYGLWHMPLCGGCQ